MPIEKRIPKNRFLVDFVAYDKAGKPVLFGWTTSTTVSPEAIDHLVACLNASRSKIPFALLADSDQLLIYRKNIEDHAETVWTSPTATILAHYDPDLGRSFDLGWPEPKPGSVLAQTALQLHKRRIFAHYLTTLIQAWLRDLAYRWKSSVPPAMDEMANIGLLERLEGGTTKSEVWLAGNPLP
jgi:hypothetical protein